MFFLKVSTESQQHLMIFQSDSRPILHVVGGGKLQNNVVSANLKPITETDCLISRASILLQSNRSVSSSRKNSLSLRGSRAKTGRSTTDRLSGKIAPGGEERSASYKSRNSRPGKFPSINPAIVDLPASPPFHQYTHLFNIQLLPFTLLPEKKRSQCLCVFQIKVEILVSPGKQALEESWKRAQQWNTGSFFPGFKGR